MNKFDVLVIGAGPGGYVAAIRAAQLGKRVAVVERAELGGVCLNWGCIPTKSLLKSAEVYLTSKNAKSYGVEIGGDIKPDFVKIIERSRRIAQQMSKGIEFLFNKHQITVVRGEARLIAEQTVQVSTATGDELLIEAADIIIATGASVRPLPHLPIDGERIIGYRQALTLKQLPASMLVVGSGAIGVELAYFYAAMGTKVTVVERERQLSPLLESSVAEVLERGLKKLGIKVLTGSTVELLSNSGDGCVCKVTSDGSVVEITSTVILSATGIIPNTANLGLETLGVKLAGGRIVVNEHYQTSVSGVWAIGDVIDSPALAHVAQAEGIACAEFIAGHTAALVNYNAIPACIYTQPEVATVGIMPQAAAARGIVAKIGQFPFSALGKATATGNREGFACLCFDEATNKLLGAQIVGHGVTELIAELTLAITQGLTAHDIVRSVHAHPSMSEAIAEAAAQYLGECVHL